MSGPITVRGAPSNDALLLRLFVDLVAEYDDFGAAFPMSVTSLEIHDLPIPPAQRWHRTVRLLALRKFFLGAQDAVRVDRVSEAFDRCVTDGAPSASEAVKDEIDAVLAWAGSDRARIVEDLLYGIVLHGEYEKQQRSLHTPQRHKDEAMWGIGEKVEFLVRNLRTEIIEAAEENRLTPKAQSAVRAP